MQTIIAQQLLSCGVQKEHRVLVGVSGGADSVALLHAMCALREQHVIADVAAAHLHHGIRGVDADADMAYVRALCASLHVQLETAHADVPALAKSTGKTLEEAAREARIAFLHQAKDKLCAHWIALAHHAGDQAETILMHLIRGSGLNGLQGMQPVRDDIIRPLLLVSRKTIIDYVSQHGLQYRSDVTNEDLHYTRNRVRHQLLPLLKEFNPSIEESLCRMAQRLAEDEAYLMSQAETVLKSARHEDGVSRQMLAAAERPIQIRVFQILLKQYHVHDTSENLLNRLCELLTAHTGTKVQITDKLSARAS
jgi:tRNA(Ile)-lysidine synthase